MTEQQIYDVVHAAIKEYGGYKGTFIAAEKLRDQFGIDLLLEHQRLFFEQIYKVQQQRREEWKDVGIDRPMEERTRTYKIKKNKIIWKT